MDDGGADGLTSFPFLVNSGTSIETEKERRLSVFQSFSVNSLIACLYFSMIEFIGDISPRHAVYVRVLLCVCY